MPATGRNTPSVSPGSPARCRSTPTGRPASGICTSHGAGSPAARTGGCYALDPGLYKLKLKELSRALERELGLRIVSSDRAPDAKTRAADRNEFEEARRLGTGLKQIRNAIHDCLQRADNGAAFKAALDAAGLVLAQGDKRDCFVVVDQAGGHHALNKKLTGLTLAQLRIRLGDLDRAQLPGVAEAKTRQRARQPARDFSRASRTAAKPAQEAVETPKHRRAANLPEPAPTASTGRERARAPPIDGQGLSPLFRRLARALTVRVGQAMTAPRRRGGNTGGAFTKLARKFSRRCADMRQDFKARAAITERGIRIDPAAYEIATGYLADTLDQLNRLNNDAEHDSGFDESYDDSQNNISPHL